MLFRSGRDRDRQRTIWCTRWCLLLNRALPCIFRIPMGAYTCTCMHIYSSSHYTTHTHTSPHTCTVHVHVARAFICTDKQKQHVLTLHTHSSVHLQLVPPKLHYTYSHALYNARINNISSSACNARVCTHIHAHDNINSIS